MNIGTIVSVVGLGVTILGVAVTYGVLKQKVDRCVKDIDTLNHNYGNIYSMLTDIRVQISAIITKMGMNDNMVG